MSRLGVGALGALAVLLFASAFPAPAASPPEQKFAPGLVEAFEGRSRAQAMIHFTTAIDPVILAGAGVGLVDELSVIPTALVDGAPEAILALARSESVRYLEPNARVSYDLDSATRASRARYVWDAAARESVGLPDPRNPAGNPIDGRGVTVAVVDSGVNAIHPDLLWHRNVVQNLYPVSPTPYVNPPGDPFAAPVVAFVDIPLTAIGVIPGSQYQNQHGQHVAGIVAGTGNASDGKYKGAAPGATILAFGDQAGFGWWQARAWEWVYLHGNDVTPPVRIVTNSWGYGYGTCDPEITLSKLQRKLILKKGIVMTFSAGNTYGNGTTDNVRTQPHCGPEGALGVANYDDDNLGYRDGKLRNSSSRGMRTDPVSWPDLSAPGHGTVAADSFMRGTSGACLEDPLAPCDWPYYSGFGGTSAAAPHVAGTVALMLQANPALTPAEVECLLEQTAYKFPPSEIDGAYATGLDDPRYDGSNHARGHGLLDSHAAVSAALDVGRGSLGTPAWKCQGADPFTGAVR